MEKRTLVRLLRDTARMHPDSVYMKENRGSGYKGAKYREVEDEARCLAAFLVSIGMEKGDRATILAEGRNSWISSEIGVFAAGGICVPVSIKIKEKAEILFRMKHSGSRFAVTSEMHLHKIAALVGELPDLKAVVLMDPLPSGLAALPRGVPVHPWERAISAGKELLEKDPGLLDRIEAGISEDDPATLSYTSGTTAEPKGILLSHKNYFINVEGADFQFPLPSPIYTLLILPWDHSFAHTAGLYVFMWKAGVVGAVEASKSEIGTIRNIPRNIKEIGPTYLLVVPALVENFRKNIANQIAQKGGLSAALFHATIALGTRLNGDAFRKRFDPLSLLAWPVYLVLRAVVSGKVRQSLGGRLVFMVSGGSGCPTDHVRWFTALGIPVYQGYGLSETSPIISSNSNRRGYFKIGSSGKLLPWVELRVEGEKGEALPPGGVGEICVRGECNMLGYWKNEAATAEAIVDGWFHTGDLGYIDADGFLFITGRIKSLLVGANGEKYSPEALEEHLAENVEFIKQVILYNQQNPYTVALIVPDVDAVKDFMAKKGFKGNSDAEMDAVLAALRERLMRYRKDQDLMSRFVSEWSPKTFALLPEAFSEENGTVNATMKIVRRRVAALYGERIAGLYGREEDPLNQANREVLRAWLAAAAKAKA